MAVKAVIAVDTEIAVVPAAIDVVVVLDPYDAVVPYSNQAVAVTPFGFTGPFKVALLPPIPVAEPVVTVGGFANVVKVVSPP